MNGQSIALFILVGLFTSACSQRQGDIRLVNGGNQFEGRVELYYNGIWGTLCDDYWDQRETNVVCRQLGFSETGNTYSCCSRYYGAGNGGIWFAYQNCIGNERRLIDCPGMPIGRDSCSHNEDVGVRCLPACQGSSVRLSGGLVPEQGTAEICIDGRWTGICDDYWDYKDAFVLCRQLGYPASDVAVYHNSFFGIYTSYLLSSRVFNCLGNEATLSNCHSTGRTCDYNNLAGVYCKGDLVSNSTCSHGDIRLVGGQESNEGRVEVCTNGLWGTVNERSWDYNDAIVACRQLGYEYPSRISLYSSSQSRTHFGIGKGPIVLSEVACDGSESSLSNCTSNPYYYSTHSNDIGLKCQHIPQSRNCAHDSVRLVGGNSSYEGRVEICKNGLWGSVCDYAWDNNDAAVVCQQLGFARENATALRGSTFGEGTGPYHLSAAGCGLHEDSLLECSGLNITYASYDCIPGHDAGVRCEPSIHCNHGDVRLYGGYTNQDGIAEVCIDGHWGNICHDYWNFNDARVFCRQLKGSDLLVDYSTCCSKTRYLGNISLTNLQCAGNENRIVGICSYGFVTGSYSSGCSLQEESVVGCYEQSSCVHGDVQLLDGSNEVEGRIEVCLDGIWRAVTQNWWDQNDAVVVCRQMGHSYQWAQAVRQSTFGRGNAPFGVQYIGCSGTESHLVNCSFNWIGIQSLNNPRTISYSLNFRNYGTAGVICQGPILGSPECEEGSVQLVNGEIETEGRVEICYNGTWIVVCDRGWGVEETLTVCRQLGYSTYDSIYLRSSFFGNSISAPIFHQFSCPSEASNISQCSMNIHYSNYYCHRGTTVGVRCKEVSYYNVTITSSREGPYQLGSNVKLSCHIEPEPPNVTSTYQWGSSYLLSRTSTLPDTAVTIGLNHPSEALYHCTVYNQLNNVRLGYGSTILQTKGVVHPAIPTSIEALLQETITLQVNSTDSESDIDYLRELAWYHNGQRVESNEQTELSDDNRTLTISNTTQENSGVYEARFEGLFVYPHDRLCEKLAVGLLRDYPLLKPVLFYVNNNESTLSTARVVHGVTINNVTDAIVSFTKDDNVSLYVDGHFTSLSQVDESLITILWYINGVGHSPPRLETIHHNNMISQVSDYRDMDLADSGMYEVFLVLDTYLYFTRHYPHCQTYYDKFFSPSNRFGSRYVILSKASAKLQYYEMLSFTFEANNAIISPSGSTALTCSASIKFPPFTTVSIIKDNKTLASSTSESVQVNTKNIGVSPFGVYTCVVDASGTLLKKEASIKEGDPVSSSVQAGGLFAGGMVVGIVIAVLITVIIVVVLVFKRRKNTDMAKMMRPTPSRPITNRNEVKSTDERYARGTGVKPRKPNLPVKPPTRSRSGAGGRPTTTAATVAYKSKPPPRVYEPMSPLDTGGAIYEDTEYM